MERTRRVGLILCRADKRKRHLLEYHRQRLKKLLCETNRLLRLDAFQFVGETQQNKIRAPARGIWRAAQHQKLCPDALCLEALASTF